MFETPARHSGWNENRMAEFGQHPGSIDFGPFVGRLLLHLRTTGAKMGSPRTASVIYSREGDRSVTVEVGAEKFMARASMIGTETERRRLWLSATWFRRWTNSCPAPGQDGRAQR